MQSTAKLTVAEPPVEAPGSPHLSYPLLLDVSSLKLTDRQLEQISVDNGSLQLELTAKGELVIMPPSGDPGQFQETELSRQVSNWARQDGSGVTSGSSGGFRLPNGALYVPDVSWVTKERLEAWRREREEVPEENRGSFPGLCPDFVLELRSPGDTLISVQRKMQEYMENGAPAGLAD